MFALAATIIYGEPFQRNQPPGSLLCQTLLQSHFDHLPQVLQIAYFPEPNDTSSVTVLPSPPFVDYSSFIRNMHFDLSMFKINFMFSEKIRAKLDMYAATHPLQDLERLIQRSLQTVRPRNFGRTVASHLRTALTWVLCDPVLEQIRSIDIPLSDITRYLAVVHRFQSLSFVNFVIDIAVNYQPGPLALTTLQAPDQVQEFQQTTNQLFEDMVRFVEESIRLFGKQLRQVEFPELYDGHCTQQYPKPIMIQIMQALPPLDSPRHLHERNWLQFVSHLESTCLDSVLTINAPTDELQWLTDLIQAGEYLPRCRSLKTLHLPYFVPGAFQWAVDEKNHRGTLGQDLVPLRRISIIQFNSNPVLEIDDIAYAFSDTLEDFTYDCNCLDEEDEETWNPIPQNFTAGYKWTTMPVLKSLSILMDNHVLALDPNTLALCPALQIIDISDYKQNFSPASRIWMEPFKLPGLTRIKLQGSSAIGFNLDTFRSTPRLERVELSMSCSFLIDNSLDLPAQEYDVSLPNSPRKWTWNWDLPCLTSLELGPGFASIFQFRMLEGCPALTLLRLMMTGPDVPQEGVEVSDRDLIHSIDKNRFFSCPSMTSLYLFGPWVLRPLFLQTLFGNVMPNLKDVFTMQCLGHSIAEWVEATTQLPQLTSATAIRPDPDAIEQEMAGLVPVNNHHSQLGSEGDVCSPTFYRIYDHRNGLMDAIRDNGILVVIGETGSGKTTQLPRYVIEEFQGMKVGVTQPRRIAAISVAKRVAEEYDCRLGDTVGYTIRFDDTTSSRTRLKYMTDGVLLREATMDPLLEKYDLLVIDEAHERTVETDVLFGLLKRTKVKRPELKLLIMSATLNVTKFSDFFDECPIYTIPGRTYPVEILHSRDNTKLGLLKSGYVGKAVETVMHILTKEIRPGDVGDILVFLTGQNEIERACQDLKKAILDKKHKEQDQKELSDRHKHLSTISLDQIQILPLYASLELLDQTAIFGPSPRGSRKVIFATNIAQTSVTIPNIRFVVDSGFVKQKMYDSSTGMDALLVVPISKAAATQRAGRAGRTRAGICFRLYSRDSFETEMEEETVPEIMRTGLTGTVLSLKNLGIRDVNGFEFLDPPREEELLAALRELYLVGAIDKFGELTDVGSSMIRYPVNPLLARSLVEAEKLGCLDNALTIVAMLSIEEPFYLPRHQEEQEPARQSHTKFLHHTGDHMTLLNVYEAWRDANYSKNWCHDNFFNLRQLRLAKNIRSQLRDIVDRKHSRKDNSSSSSKKETAETHQSQSSSSSRTILQAFAQGYGLHLSKKHHHRQMFYHFLASSASPSAGHSGATSSLLALHTSPLSALYLDEENSITKHGRKVARDLEWVIYHEVVFHVKAVMRYVSKIDHQWVRDTLDRAKLFDQGQVWLNGESKTPTAPEYRKRDSEAMGSPDVQDGGLETSVGETEEQAKKRVRLELVEAARKRALERRQNK
ncbi:DEAH-box ATP-dependent RNA helicase prp22 [Podila clonocystis]|nr:DEAH-box ATP-dependent RNA helicase prp22 [Podila clonocystis]